VCVCVCVCVGLSVSYPVFYSVKKFLYNFTDIMHISNTFLLLTNELVLCECLRLRLYQSLNLTNHPFQIEDT